MKELTREEKDVLIEKVRNLREATMAWTDPCESIWKAIAMVEEVLPEDCEGSITEEAERYYEALDTIASMPAHYVESKMYWHMGKDAGLDLEFFQMLFMNQHVKPATLYKIVNGVLENFNLVDSDTCLLALIEELKK